MTNFGAILEFSAADKNNSSVGSHAVIFTFFVNTNWRKGKYRRAVENVGLVDNETILSDCER